MANIIKKENGHTPATFGSVVDQIFQNNLSRFFDDSFWGFKGFDSTGRIPVNILETGNSFEMELPMPGIQKEKLNLEITNDSLTVSYEDAEETKEKEENYVRREFKRQSFHQNFHLNDSIDTGNISAKYENGVLHLILPKSEKAKKVSRTIAVQ
ncbi:Hsp20/alpha crystallin family protein [Pseudoflavitalea sp. G-6-1-2]|uniref:Hsp20/alpha crystallin family protein n=1 Tax=Pseudoflavitalea sp. G-6-1-2 TaxID=2728841 RepID=UPI00146DAB2F|nr:Hsp20/alpha crystallin family protein [Pseudoflavitalea sp. G-6-1-2]NML23103.1 Hsp20/alpha crystallin family protein [Pseudoflavitalea sp. G-6-1-2]